jgi:hypothetical protein
MRPLAPHPRASRHLPSRPDTPLTPTPSHPTPPSCRTWSRPRARCASACAPRWPRCSWASRASTEAPAWWSPCSTPPRKSAPPGPRRCRHEAAFQRDVSRQPGLGARLRDKVPLTLHLPNCIHAFLQLVDFCTCQGHMHEAISRQFPFCTPRLEGCVRVLRLVHKLLTCWQARPVKECFLHRWRNRLSALHRSTMPLQLPAGCVCVCKGGREKNARAVGACASERE